MSPATPMTRLMYGVPSSCCQVGGRVEDDDVAALVGVEARRQLVDEDVLVRLEGRLHRLLLDLVRLGDERLDDEEDDEGEDERLDDLEEAPEAGVWSTSRGVYGDGRRGRGRRTARTRSASGGDACTARGPDGFAYDSPAPCAPVTRSGMPIDRDPYVPTSDGSARGREHGARGSRGGVATPMTAATLQLIILPAGIIAVLFAIYLARDVLSRDTGHPGDAGRRRHDLRGRGRLHPAPVHDDRRPRRRRRGDHRRRHRARRDARGRGRAGAWPASRSGS